MRDTAPSPVLSSPRGLTSSGGKRCREGRSRRAAGALPGSRGGFSVLWEPLRTQPRIGLEKSFSFFL